MKYDFLIIGAGIFGIFTAIELCRKKYKVAIINPDTIPHPLAASTDISKIIRMEYGSDVEYMNMAIEAMQKWREWNELLNEQIYHEVGFMVLSQNKMEQAIKGFEYTSYQNLLKQGMAPKRLDTKALSEQFPAFNSTRYTDGFYHQLGGFGESGKVVELLINYAKKIGVNVFENQTATEIKILKNKVDSVLTKEGRRFKAGQVIVCAGNFTPYLLPELKPYMKVTGHPVFHIKPSQPDLFTYPNCSVFAADISNTGWYGFPLHPKEKVVKIARHSQGLLLDPTKDERVVGEEDIKALRFFLRETFPSLLADPIVYTRRCCYTDTLDGHFWIDKHPAIAGLSVGSGGSGHGFKMGPIVGEMIATMAEGGSHKYAKRYRWRTLDQSTKQEEEARFLK